MRTNKPSLRDMAPSERIGAILAFLAIVTLITHIIRCGADMGQTETALFGILQFVFSIGFAWILSRSSCKREFQESQKGFAIAAYRRIREIESGLTRLLQRIGERRHECSDDVEQELDVICEIARGMETTTRSSISDWADIIGDEIATIEEVKRLRSEPDTYKVRVTDSLKKIDDLLSRLPASLQVTERTDRDDERREIRTFMACDNELSDHGSITLDGFWAADYDLDKDIRTCDKSETFFVTLAPRKREQGPLNLFDAKGLSVGRITNKYMLSEYDTFARVLCKVVGSSRFPVLLERVREQDTDSQRVYFTVRYRPARPETSDHTSTEEHPTTASTATNEPAAAGPFEGHAKR